MYVRDALRLLLKVYLRPQWLQVVLLATLLFSGIGIQLINPQLIRYVLDTAERGPSQSALTLAACLFIAFSLTKAVLSFGARYVSAGIGWTATNLVRADLTVRCLHLDMSFHNATTPGTLITRIDGDASELGSFFSDLVLNVIGNGVLVGGVLVILLVQNWQIGLVAVLFTAATLLILQRMQRRTVRLYGAMRSASASLNGFVEERLAGTEDIRANGGEAYVLRQLSVLRRTLSLGAMRARMMGVHTFSATHLVFVLANVLGLGLGAVLYLRGEMTIGDVYVIVFYIAMLQGPLESLRDQVHDLQQAAASAGRINELLNAQPAVRDAGQAALPSGRLGVQCEGVSFVYASAPNSMPLHEDGAARGEELSPASALRDIAFTLAPGRVLGLLGRTGSGKTTLTRLLIRLYDPTTGTVRLGGQALGDVPTAELRKRVGMVTQDIQLFQATLRENIAFFDPGVADAQILGVLQRLGLWQWYARLPHGLETRLGAGGAGLSAGEAQLLALVRVFLKDPGLVILDEASSRLDPATEQLLERVIDGLLVGRTGVVIAHRLRTVQRADDIMILERGRIVEWGQRIALSADPYSRFSQLLRTGLQEELA